MLASIGRRVAALPARVPGYTRALRLARSRSVPIVMYHGILSEPLPYTNWCQLLRNQFVEQIEFLKNNYRVLALSEIVQLLQADAALPERVAAITFDDGFLSVYSNGFPVLQQHQLPFTVFLVTSLVGSIATPWPENLLAALLKTPSSTVVFQGRQWPLEGVQQRFAAWNAITPELVTMPDEQKEQLLQELLHRLGPAEIAGSAFAIMGWDEVRSMAATGLAEFGSHTHTHVILSRCSEHQQRYELQHSREVLLAQLGKAGLVAYPNGTRSDFTAVTKRLAKELGYGCALTTISGLNRRHTDLYELRRVNVGADATLDDFEMLMLGF